MDEKPKETGSLKTRINALRESQEERKRPKGGFSGASRSGMGLGMRMAIELVAAIGFGVALGLFLDKQLGTKPWMMLVFVLLGTAAGFMNVIRAAQAFERRAKEEREAEAKAAAARDKEGGQGGV